MEKKISRIRLHYRLNRQGLWERPLDEEAFRYAQFRMNLERRADLFACQKLLQQNRIAPILHVIQRLGLGTSTIASASALHPSGLERALYMAGFLLSHMIDVSMVLKDYEHHGICIDAETVYLLENESIPF